MDKEALDQVHRENQELDQWKNQFLVAESSAIVMEGLIAKIGDRTFKLTPAGVAQASSLQPADEDFRKPDRGLAVEVNKIISHPTFASGLAIQPSRQSFTAPAIFGELPPVLRRVLSAIASSTSK